jgi:hypothetical protein
VAKAAFRPAESKWFTLDHPGLPHMAAAFEEWREGGSGQGREGDIIFEQVPLYVHGDFEGPLRAVLTQRRARSTAR